MLKNSPEKFSRFVVTSVGLHVGLIAFAVLGPSLFPAPTSAMWGSDSGRGGSVTVGVVASLPGIELPSPAVVDQNAAASESKSLHAAPPAPSVPEKVEAEPEVLIPSRTAKAMPEKAPARAPSKAVTPALAPPNAVPGAAAQVAVPYGQSSPGTGPATFGDEAFGQRYGAYVQAMTNAIREKWQEGVGGIGRARSPRVYVTFTILRDGEVSNVAVAETSGNTLLDNSAMRAVLTARIQALPRDYSGSSVDVRFYFEYAR